MKSLFPGNSRRKRRHLGGTAPQAHCRGNAASVSDNQGDDEVSTFGRVVVDSRARADDSTVAFEPEKSQQTGVSLLFVRVEVIKVFESVHKPRRRLSSAILQRTRENHYSGARHGYRVHS